MSVNDLCLQLAEKEVERMKKEEEVIRLKIQIKSDTLDSPIPPSATDNTDIKVSVTEESIKGASPPDGVKRPKASRIKPIEICQMQLMRGFNEQNCAAICAKNTTGKIAFSQCSSASGDNGLCGKHYKQNVSDGGLRCGRCDTVGFTCLTPETFGTPEFRSAQVVGHQSWARRVLHNLPK